MSTAIPKSFIVSVAVFLATLMIFTGCGEDKSPTRDNETCYLTVTFGASSTEVNLGDLARHTIDGAESVLLSDLVDTSTVTEPQNYAYRLIGEDGFYAHKKGNPDNTWKHLQAGYLILSTMRASFDPSLELISRYSIKDVAEMKILRKIDVVTPADSLVQFIVEEMETTAFEDTLTGIRLAGFITPEIADDPSAYSYNLVAADDYTITITCEQLIEGYYVIEYDQVIYSDADIPSRLKIKQLNRIIVLNPAD